MLLVLKGLLRGVVDKLVSVDCLLGGLMQGVFGLETLMSVGCGRASETESLISSITAWS